MAVAARYLSKVMNLPGLTMINRVGGAAVALGWGIVILLVVLNLALVLPLPASWDQAIEDSTVAQAIAGPDALPQQAFESVGSSQVLASLTALQSVLGTSRAVPEGNEIIIIPPAPEDEIRQVRDEVADLMVRINEYRAGQGLERSDHQRGVHGCRRDPGCHHVHDRSHHPGHPAGRKRRRRPDCGRRQTDFGG